MLSFTSMFDNKQKTKSKVQEEAYLRLIEAAANNGFFNRENLRDGKDVKAIAEHLRGVSEIVAFVWEETK